MIELFLGTALWSVLVAQGQATPTTSGKVLFEYSDSALSDADWTRLLKAIAAETPVKLWPEVTVRSGEDFAKLLNRYYDIEGQVTSPGVSQPLPGTAAELKSMIEGANNISVDALKPGLTLRIPPLPVRSQLAAETDESVRIFDPALQAYAVVEPTGDLRAGITRSPNLSARAIKRVRRSDRTMLPLSAEAAVELVDIGTIRVPPGHVSVELLQTPACPSADAAMKGSPYLALAQARINQVRERVLAAATTKKLVLVDFDFKDGHGAKVRSAALWLLTSLGIPELSKSIVSVDLNPAAYQTQTLRVPEELYGPARAYWRWGQGLGVIESSVRDVAWWLMTAEPGVNEAVYTVPPALLQAAIWQALDSRHWLNLSWRVSASSGALPVELDTLLRRSGSFISVAAGNERDEMRSHLTPQSAASDSFHFVNVTYGTPTGNIFGSWTNSQGGRVDVMAAGCGFSHGALTPDTRGSSFASPITAASAWLKHLLDETPAGEMRQQLINASLMTPALRTKIMSAGFLDPARLIANVGSHYVNREHTKIVSVDAVELITDGCGTFRPDPARPNTQDVVVYEEGSRHLLLHRRSVDEIPFIRVERPCEVKTLALRATADGRPLEIKSPQDFIALIGQLTF